MRYVEAQLSGELEYIDLYAVSDIHRGNHKHNEKAWTTLLSNIAKDEHAFLVLNGDLVEAALKSSKYGDTYRSMPPGEERRQVQRELEAVKSKILCVTAGNHEARHKDSDENPAELVADHLGLLDVYDQLSVVLDVNFGSYNGEKDRTTNFSFYVTHGRGGGRRPGGKINRMQELAWVIEGVDGYIQGHVHDLMSRIEYRNVADTRNKQVGQRPVAYVVAGSFLDYGDYAEEAGYAPNAVSMPILRLFQKRRDDEHKHMEIVLPTRIRRAG